MAETEINSIQERRLELVSSPHLHSRWTTPKAMWFVVIALLPAVISAIIYFGAAQLLVIGTTTITALITEQLIKKIRKQPPSARDGSAVITGLLLGLILPPDFSLSSAALGSIVAVGVGKEVFGGLGFNIFNPALVGRAFLQAAFPVEITTWVQPNYSVDAVTSATPLAAAKFDNISTGISNLFFGNVGGSLGETSALAILLGGMFLIFAGIVNWRIPVSMILGALIFGGIFHAVDPAVYPGPVFHLFAGGFLFGAFFMATDWVTSPLTAKGMWIYGFAIALIVIMIRLFGGLPEGVMYAILFMNAFVPLINKFTRPMIFGAADE